MVTNHKDNIGFNTNPFEAVGNVLTSDLMSDAKFRDPICI